MMPMCVCAQGAASIGFHMLSSESFGLYHQVIIESGYELAQYQYSFTHSNYHPRPFGLPYLTNKGV